MKPVNLITYTLTVTRCIYRKAKLSLLLISEALCLDAIWDMTSLTVLDLDDNCFTKLPFQISVRNSYIESVIIGQILWV
jgi:hypothetical protein